MIIRERFWVASGKVDFTPLDKKVTQLANNGTTFVGKQLLAKRLARLTPAEVASNGRRKKKKR